MSSCINIKLIPVTGMTIKMDILDITSHILTFLPFAHKYMYISKIFMQSYFEIQKEYINLFYKEMIMEQQINAAAYLGDLYTILYLVDQDDTLFIHAFKCLHICNRHGVIAFILHKQIMNHMYENEDIKWIIHYVSCLKDLGYQSPWSKKSLYEYHTSRMKRLPIKDIVGTIHPQFAWDYCTSCKELNQLNYESEAFIKNLADFPDEHLIFGYRYIDDNIKESHMIGIIKNPHKRLFDVSLEGQKVKVEDKLKAIKSCKIVSPSVISTIKKIRELNVQENYPYRIEDFNSVIQMILTNE